MSGIIKLKLKHNGELKTPHLKHRKVKKGEDFITWKVKGKGIDSFRLTSKYPEKPYPFYNSPDPGIFQPKKIRLRVKDVTKLQEWDYNIIWKSDPLNPKFPDGEKIDPKIVLEPETNLTEIVIIAFASAVLLVLIPFAFKFFKRERR